MKVLITGGTGLIGRALCPVLLQLGHQVSVFSRHPDTVSAKCGGAQPLSSFAAIPELGFDAVINLAGEPIVGARWTERRKQMLRASRVTLTEQLVAQLARSSKPPSLLISGSATGYYGDGGDTALDETSPVGGDFGARLCLDWEAAAEAASSVGIRVCRVRTGLVLSSGGGLLGQMLPAFKLGLGARLGDGRQWMSWIHMDDYIGILLGMLEDSTAAGPFNLTAPNPVTNGAFTRVLGKVLNRPVWFSAPTILLKAALGEMAELLLGGQRALPRAIEERGYRYRFTELDEALGDLLARG